MKIKECSVIDNKVIDELMAECMHPAIYEVLEYIKSHSKPLEPIVRDAVDFAYYNSDLWEGFDQYINETEI
jgi:hypothetical protein